MNTVQHSTSTNFKLHLQTVLFKNAETLEEFYKRFPEHLEKYGSTGLVLPPYIGWEAKDIYDCLVKNYIVDEDYVKVGAFSKVENIKLNNLLVQQKLADRAESMGFTVSWGGERRWEDKPTEVHESFCCYRRQLIQVDRQHLTLVAACQMCEPAEVISCVLAHEIGHAILWFYEIGNPSNEALAWEVAKTLFDEVPECFDEISQFLLSTYMKGQTRAEYDAAIDEKYELNKGLYMANLAKAKSKMGIN